MASVNYDLYLDTSVTPDNLRHWLVEEHGFAISTTQYTEEVVSVLVNKGRLVWVDPPDPDHGGPYIYKQDKTVCITLDPNLGSVRS